MKPAQPSISTARAILTACTLWLVIIGSAGAGIGDLFRRKADLPELLRNGKAALEDENYDLAEDQLRRYVKKTDKDSEEAQLATVLLAQAVYHNGKYREVVKLLSPARGGAYVFWRTMALYAEEKYEDVLSDLKSFAKKYEGDPYVVRSERLRSKCFIQLDRTDEALAVFAAIEKDHGDSPEAPGNLLDWARVLVSAGKRKRAQKTLGTLIERMPGGAEGQQGAFLLGQLLLEDEQWDAAEKALLPLSGMVEAQNEHRVGARISLARVHEARKGITEATNMLHEALTIADTPELKRQCHVAFGRLFLRTGRIDEGIAILKPVIAGVPRPPQAGALQLEIADVLLGNNQAERAAQAFQHYLETFSDPAGQATALSGRGWALWLLPEPSYSEAAASFKKAYEIYEDPKDKAKSLMKVGDSQFRNTRYSMAIETYRALMTEFPESALVPQALFQVAESSARTGDIDEAERQFVELASAKGGDQFSEQAMLRIAELKEESGDLLAALAGYERFMNAYTNSALFANALHGHGLISYRLLRFEGALSDFQNMVKLAPQSELAEQAFYMRGWCYQMLGREADALATCRTFVHEYPNSRWTPEVMFWIGEYEFNHERFAQAEEQFQQLAVAYEKRSLAELALLWAGKSAARQKEYLRANEHFQTLASKYPESERLAEARFSQGDVLSELGKYSSAIVIFEEVIKKYSSYIVDLAWGRKGDCQFALGGEDPARYEAAMLSYGVVANSPTDSPELKLQAEYKVGRCLQKMGRVDEAYKQYYLKVLIPYLADKADGIRHNGGADIWFTDAAFKAAEILEEQKKLNEAVKILKRVIEAGVPGEAEARERISKIRRKHLRLFY